jgi:hypothetical protein
MIQKNNLLLSKSIFIFFIISLSVNKGGDKVLLYDDFSELKPQMISGDVVGALSEYHNIAATQPKGNWVVSCFRSDPSQRAWRVIVEDGKHIMHQTYTSTRKYIKYTHPMLIAGDELWKDYTTEIVFAPESIDEQSGLVFRYQNDRCYYFFGVINGKVIIKKVKHADSYRTSNQTILAEKEIEYRAGEILTAKVTVTEDHISGEIKGVTLEAEEPEFQKGKVGLMSDVPTKYYSVKVTTDNSSFDEFTAERKKYNDEVNKLRAGNPKPVIWKKFSTDGFGAPRSLRFGDLDMDGQVDILIGQVLNHGPKDRNSEVGCLTALTVDGKELWQLGRTDLWNDKVTCDVAFQIYDIDGDGRNEVIYCKDMELRVADGATGNTKYKIETPINESSPPRNLTPRILGDAIAICNVRGLDHPQDILLKDRYEHFYLYNDKLELLWKGACTTGHYPYVWDYDGDGKDEIAIGYSLYDDDGTQLFTLENDLKDHADGVSIIRFREDHPYVIMNAASDEGIVFYDMNGKILKHQYIGHVQNPAVANLRNDLPGLEAVTVNFWGNQGIVHMFNSDMEIYNEFEPFQQGSPMRPINWTGKEEEYLVLSSDPNYGGMIDGWGRRVVMFPADGHPDMCYAVLDMTGDCRDEIVVWDTQEIWIYTQDDNPKNQKMYKPQRDPLYNFSNYSTAVSLPGYSDE